MDWILFTILALSSTSLVSSKVSAEDECQDGWMLIHRSCILFVRTFATWDDAIVDCWNKGGHLAIISDKQEEDGFRNVMGKQIKSSRNHTYWWIGLRRVTNYTTGDDGYYWTDGEKYNQKIPQWAPGEPSSGKSSSSGNGIEDCVQLNYQTYLADEKCDSKKPYICEELRLTPPPNITSISTDLSGQLWDSSNAYITTALSSTEGYKVSAEVECQDGWMLIHRSCILFVRTFATWDDAKMDCENNGGHLAIISSKQEEDGFRNVMGSQIKRSRNHTYWWIGLWRVTNYTTGDDGYYWTDGEKYNQKEPQWAPGEPSSGKSSSSGNEIEDCVQLNYQTWLADEKCNSKKPYICEELRLTPPPSITSISTDLRGHSSNAYTTTALSSTEGYKECGTPGNGINTDRPTVTDTTYKGTATYTCLPGFDIADKEDLSITCQQDGTWEPIPICTQAATPVTASVAQPPRITCPVSTDQRGHLWNSSNANTTTTLSCEHGYRGQIQRYCDSHGVFHLALYNCTFETISNIKKKLSSEEGWNSTEILGELAEIIADNNETMYEGDLSVIGEILNAVAENFTGGQDNTNTFYKVVDNIIDEEHSLSWGSLEESGENGAETLLQSVDKTNEKIMTAVMDGKMAGNISLDGRNLYLSVRLTEEESDGDMIVFPEERTHFSSHWSTTEQATIFVPLPHGIVSLAYTGILYRNVSQLLSGKTVGTSRKEVRQGKNTILNSAVISFSLPEAYSGKLKAPVTIHFKAINKNSGKSICSFFNLTTKSWETNGCWEDALSANAVSEIITCKCNHLTNFALLMSPVGVSHMTTAHTRALSILTMCGITLSSVCLLVNIIMYTIFWRSIASEANIIILNVCIVLLVANGVFIFGVTKTSDTDVCTAIAVLLHFLYLAFFLLLLAVGINLTTNAMSTKKRKLGALLCCLAYVLAGVIVGISAGLYRLEGYGNENFCWLGNDSGQVWTFIGPALAVILTNVSLIVVVMHKYLGLSINQKKNVSGKIKAAAKALGAMLSATGVTWIFGVLSVNHEMLVFQYLFVVCNSLQGVFIMIFYGIMNTKIRQKLSERFGGVSSVTRTSKLAKQTVQSSDRYLTSDV